jgi:hypothetical protein
MYQYRAPQAGCLDNGTGVLAHSTQRHASDHHSRLSIVLLKSSLRRFPLRRGIISGGRRYYEHFLASEAHRLDASLCMQSQSHLPGPEIAVLGY